MAVFNNSTEICFTIEKCKMRQMSSAYHRPLLEIERNFDECNTFDWLMKNWKINYVFIGVYLVAIFAGQHYMKSRKPFRLRGALFLWNAALAVFSIFAAWRSITAVLYQIYLVGFHDTICSDATSKQFQQSVALYLWLFALSKFVELGDTAFIVLRKTPLIFLHWFHHATVCFFVWSCGAYPSPLCVFFMIMNYFVHSIMYSYYTLKVLKVRVPKPVNIAITSLQLFQMLGGVAVTLYVYRMKSLPGVGCCVFDEAINIGLSIYFAYFVLFLQFFAKAYLLDKPERKVVHAKSE